MKPTVPGINDEQSLRRQAQADAIAQATTKASESVAHHLTVEEALADLVVRVGTLEIEIRELKSKFNGSHESPESELPSSDNVEEPVNAPN